MAGSCAAELQTQRNAARPAEGQRGAGVPMPALPWPPSPGGLGPHLSPKTRRDEQLFLRLWGKGQHRVRQSPVGSHLGLGTPALPPLPPSYLGPGNLSFTRHLLKSAFNDFSVLYLGKTPRHLGWTMCLLWGKLLPLPSPLPSPEMNVGREGLGQHPHPLLPALTLRDFDHS